MKPSLVHTLTGALALAAGLFTFAAGENVYAQEAAAPEVRTFQVNGIELGKATFLFRADVAGMEGKEVVVELFELAPRGSFGKHYHPGHEVAYVLEGSGIREMDGHPRWRSRRVT